MKRTAHLTIAALCAGISVGVASAQEDSFMPEELTWFDLISQAEPDALFLLAMLIGHVTAETNNTTMTGPMLEATVSNFDVTCGEHPGMPAIEAVQLG